MNSGWARYLCFGLLAVLLPFPGSAEESRHLDQTRQNLESIRTRLESATSELAEKQRAAHHLVKQLGDVDKRLKRTVRKVRQTERKIDELGTEIKHEEAALAEGREQIQGLEIQLRQRLIALYKGGETQVVELLFSSQSPAELIENYAFLRRLVEWDRQLLNEYRNAVAANEKSLTHLERLKKSLEETYRQQREGEKALRQARSDKSGLLKKVKRDELALGELVAELEEKAARLSSLVNKLETKKPGAYTERASDFLQQKGGLDWPVKGKIQTRFGKGVHAEFGTQYDSHGIEFSVVDQQPIHSVWNGEVVFANTFRGYGNLMIIDHGGGYYSLYAQASRLLKGVGEHVGKGETIAYSGFDGGDKVYFEIRKGGTPEDPASWLRTRPK